MEKYENLGTVGEGSYGVVLKCRNKTNNSIVAIKKFLESDNDKSVRKIASREIKILKSLRHENLINLIEVFRKNRRIFLVFEFIECNLLEEIEKTANGLGEIRTREVMFQVVRGIDFMHKHNIIHRDLKPENVLINKNGLVKLCDFGFARQISLPSDDIFTDYVATRWYRSPELLVGDPKYGKPVDIWSIGVLTYEVLTSKPLFPGESDLDQLYLIMNNLGDLPEYLKLCFQNNQFYSNAKLPRIRNITQLQNKLKKYTPDLVKFIMESLTVDHYKRPTSSELLKHSFFNKNSWSDEFMVKLKDLVVAHEASISKMINFNSNIVLNSNKTEKISPSIEQNEVNSNSDQTNKLLKPVQTIPIDSKVSNSSLSSNSVLNTININIVNKYKSDSKTPSSPIQNLPSININKSIGNQFNQIGKKNSISGNLENILDNISINNSININHQNSKSYFDLKLDPNDNKNNASINKISNNQAMYLMSESKTSFYSTHYGNGARKNPDLLKVVKLQNKDSNRQNEIKPKYFIKLERRLTESPKIEKLPSPQQNSKLTSMSQSIVGNSLFKPHNLNLNLKSNNLPANDLNKNIYSKKFNKSIDFSLMSGINHNNESNVKNDSINDSNNLTSYNYSNLNNNNINNFNKINSIDENFKNKKQPVNHQHAIGNSQDLRLNILKNENIRTLNFLSETNIYKLPQVKTHDTLPKQKRIIFDKKQPYLK